jgi:cell division protein FtsX
VAAPIVVVALAAGSTLVAAGYAATWEESFERTAALRAGADLSIRAGAAGISAPAIDEVAALPGVTALAAVHDENLQIGSENGSILAASPDAVAELALSGDAFDGPAIAEAMRGEVPGPVLPAEAGEATLTVEVSGFGVIPTIALQVSDAAGVLRSVPLEARRAPGTPAPEQPAGAPGATLLEYIGSLPPAPAVQGSARVLAIDIEIAGDAIADDESARFRLMGLTAQADGEQSDIPIDWYWIPESPGFAFSWPTANNAGDGFSAAGDTRTVRMVPSFTDDPGDEAVPPIVVSRRLADRFDIGVGDLITFPLENGRGRISAPVTAIAPVIPGAQDSSAVLLDIGLIQHYILRVAMDQPRTGRLWLGTGDADRVIEEARPLLPANTRMIPADDEAGRTALSSAATALWVGALGCVVLAVIAVAAAVRVSSRERRDDVHVLRALGLRARQQAAIRRTELGTVLGYGLIVGIVAGIAVVLVAVPPLARAAVPDPFPTVPTEVALDLLGGIALLAVLAAALTAVVVLAGAAVAAAARDARTADRA